jgi:peroxiredoxin Q/BCP
MNAYRDQYAQVFNNGENVVLIAISTDSAEELASWAADESYPFLLGSDEGAKVGMLYGAFVDRPGGPLDNRTAFVIGPQGKITYVAAPFRQVDPTAYEELGEAIDAVTPE